MLKHMERSQLQQLLFFMFAFSVFFLLINNAHAENSTINNQLDELSQSAKNINEQVKSVIPYEVFEFGFFGLCIALFFMRGGNQMHDSIWKVGIYAAIIAVALWFILTR